MDSSLYYLNFYGYTICNCQIIPGHHLLNRYLPETEVHGSNFDQLVTGVIWLVRNGEVYIDVSKKAECPETILSGH